GSDAPDYGMRVTSTALLDTRSGERYDLPRLARDTRVAAIAADGKSVTLSAVTVRGSYAWRWTAGRSAVQIAAANEFWQQITPPPEGIIEYVGTNGERVKGKLLLPVGYDSARRYPIIVTGRPGNSSKRSPGSYVLTAPDAVRFDLSEASDQ